MKVCPVCNRSGLADDSQECPQCNADLECFQWLETLQEEAPAVEVKRPFAMINKVVVGALAVFLVMGGLLLFGLNRKIAVIQEKLPTLLAQLPQGNAASVSETAKIIAGLSRLEAQIAAIQSSSSPSIATVAGTDTQAAESSAESIPQKSATQGGLPTQALLEETTRMIAGLNRLEAKIAAIQPQTPPVAVEDTQTPAALAKVVPRKTVVQIAHPAKTLPGNANEEGAFLLYDARDTSTLWTIASKYYGRGFYYPLLLEHNPNLSVVFDKQRGSIRILKSKEKASALFEQLAFRRQNKSFFRHKVYPGDTWAKMARRLLGSGQRANLLKSWNPGKTLAVGERINVAFGPKE